MDHYICCFCKREFKDFVNNPYPVCKQEDALCCDECDQKIVVPSRFQMFNYQWHLKMEGIEEQKLS